MKFDRLVSTSAWFTVLALLAAETSAQQLVRSVNGPAANVQFGKACIRISDQNADGYADLLVGAPTFNSQRGAVYCVSGAYLAFGTGAQILWTCAPSANQGDLFGSALAEVLDVTGDGIKDFLVGQPGYDTASMNDVGAVRLVNGVSHAVAIERHGFEQGHAFGSAIGILDPDHVVISGPGPLSAHSSVHVCPRSQFFSSGVAQSVKGMQAPGSERLGASLVAGVDCNSDGWPDIVAGAPGRTTSAGANAGGVSMLLLVPLSGSFQGIERHYGSSVAGERMGESIDASQDYNGDGVDDIVVGAPGFTTAGGTAELGRVVVLSTLQVLLSTPPFEIRVLPASVASLSGFSFSLDTHFGATVRASDDFNGDGVADILVGAPDYATGLGGTPKGAMAIFSGASGALWANVIGGSGEHFGDSLTGRIADLDGDGFVEFVAAGTLSDAGGTDSGVVKCYSLFPFAPKTYCTGKQNSLGCTPGIAFSGTPSATATTPFQITASNIVNQKNGLLFYSYAPASAAFQGGFKCAANPTVRTPVQNSGGAPTGSSCTGAYSFDFNAWIANGWDPFLAAGSEIYAQYWSRDPASASHTSLSNALRFLIHP